MGRRGLSSPEAALAALEERLDGDLVRLDAIGAQPDPAPGCLRRVLERLAPPRDAGSRIDQARARIASLAKHREGLLRAAESERHNAEEWRRRAKLAVVAADDALAEEALSRAREARTRGEDLERQAAAIAAVVAELEHALATIADAIAAGVTPSRRAGG